LFCNTDVDMLYL